MMTRYFTILGFIFLFSCGEENTSSSKVSEEKSDAMQARDAKLTQDDKRVNAVEINNELSLSQAQVYVLMDSLLKIEDLDVMRSQLVPMQIEVLGIKQRVIELNSDLEGSELFKQSILDQIDYVEKGLTVEIPNMIDIAQGKSSGGGSTSDQLYFSWVEGYEEKSKRVLQVQEAFVQKHNIRVK